MALGIILDLQPPLKERLGLCVVCEGWTLAGIMKGLSGDIKNGAVATELLKFGQLHGEIMLIQNLGSPIRESQWHC